MIVPPSVPAQPPPSVCPMLKRWAAWLRKHWAVLPQGIRRLVGGIAIVVLAVAIAWVLFVPAADWLAHHDVSSAKGPLLQTARDAARGRLLTLERACSLRAR